MRWPFRLAEGEAESEGEAASSYEQLHRLSLTEISGALAKTLPCEAAFGYGIPTAPNRSYQIVSRCGMVFVNPYTGEVEAFSLWEWRLI